MIELTGFESIYLHREPVDFRKSINGLSAVVSELQLNVFGRHLFVFCNQGHNKLKILYWDRTGFALWYKRLEKERFSWPRKMEEAVVTIDAERLKWLLGGIDVWKMRPHETLRFTQAF
jgi:transposase